MFTTANSDSESPSHALHDWRTGNAAQLTTHLRLGEQSKLAAFVFVRRGQRYDKTPCSKRCCVENNVKGLVRQLEHSCPHAREVRMLQRYSSDVCTVTVADAAKANREAKP